MNSDIKGESYERSRLGIDLGTSAVKIIAVNQSGHVITSTSVPLNLIIPTWI